MSTRLSFVDRSKQFDLAIPEAWPGTTKHVASVLFSFAGMDDGGGITASAQTIARHAGEPLSTVKRILRFLVHHGYLASDGEVRHRNGTHTKMRRLVLEKFALSSRQGGPESHPWHGVTHDTGITHETLPGVTHETLGVSPMTPKPRGITERVTESILPKNRKTDHQELPLTVSEQPSSTDAPTERKSLTRKSAAAALLPTEWEPDEAGIAFAKERGVIDVPALVGAFKDHHAARGNKMRDWAAAWRTWCRNDEKWRPTQRANRMAPDPTDPWGLKAWLAGPNAPQMIPGQEAYRWVYEEYVDVMEEIGLPETWRGDLSILGRWSRERFFPESVCFVLRQRGRRAYTSIAQIAGPVDEWAKRWSEDRCNYRIPDPTGRGFNEGEHLPQWLERRQAA